MSLYVRREWVGKFGLSVFMCVWCANIVVRNQLQLFILHIETHRATIKCATEKAELSVSMCARVSEKRASWAKWKIEWWTPSAKRQQHTNTHCFHSHSYATIFTRWRYHYKLHGINIHLPIYSMSCGSNTIHVLLLHHRDHTTHIQKYTMCKFEKRCKSKNSH